MGMPEVYLRKEFMAFGTTAFGRSFGSWGKLRMELLLANVLSPAYLNHAEENFYRGESWQSPDTVPMTDEQMKEMKLKRQPDQKAICVIRQCSASFFEPPRKTPALGGRLRRT